MERTGEWHLDSPRQLTSDLHFQRAGEAYFSPDSRLLVYQAVAPDCPHYQIYVQDVETGDPLRLSPGQGKTTCAAWRPDGRRLLYASTHLDPSTWPPPPPPPSGGRYAWDFDAAFEVFECDPDGGDLVRLTDARGYDAEASYSHDGSRIVFTSDRDGDLEVYTMAADGTDLRRVTRSPGYDGGPFFSPDDRRICFRADRHGDDLLQIYTIAADGTDERQLTANGAVNWGPYWHPDGRRIIFASSLVGHHDYEVFLIGVDGGEPERVTWTPGFDALPAWSGDGRLLAWTSKRGGGGPQVWVASWRDEP